MILLGVSRAAAVPGKGNCIGGDRMQIMGINEDTKWDLGRIYNRSRHNDRSFNGSAFRILSE